MVVVSGFLGRLKAMALGYGVVKGKGFLSQELLDKFSVKETFDYLVPECFLEAVVVAKVARLGKFTKGD